MVVAGFYVIYGVELDNKMLFKFLPQEIQDEFVEEGYGVYQILPNNINLLYDEIEEETVSTYLWDVINDSSVLDSILKGCNADFKEWFSQTVVKILLQDEEVVKQIIFDNVYLEEFTGIDYTYESFDDNHPLKKVFFPEEIYEWRYHSDDPSFALKDLPDSNIKITNGPHTARWTDHPDDSMYLGLCEHYSMDPDFKDYPFKDFDEEQKKVLIDFLKSNNFDDEPKYHILPDDCNCCS